MNQSKRREERGGYDCKVGCPQHARRRLRGTGKGGHGIPGWLGIIADGQVSFSWRRDDELSAFLGERAIGTDVGHVNHCHAVRPRSLHVKLSQDCLRGSSGAACRDMRESPGGRT